MIVEDILNTEQRAKIELFKSHLVIFLPIPLWNAEEKKIEKELVVLILMEDCLISFIEGEKKIFEPIIDRIIEKKGRIRQLDKDYLLYTLIDIIVDNFFLIVENLENEILNLENKIEKSYEKIISENIYDLKMQVVNTRKIIWPLREIISKLIRQNKDIIDEKNIIYFRDIQDHLFYLLDTIESYREIVASLRESYVTNISNRMNNIINVLTIISTIFIPLSFLAGLYGMNFVNMPELRNENGYFILITIMIIIALTMLYYFRKKKWI